MTRKFWSKIIAPVALTGAAAIPAILFAQTALPSNPFGIPESVTVFTNDNPNVRTATAIVNEFVITGTDIEQRVALVRAASETEIAGQDLENLRRQVLRNLIDETLKIQAATNLELAVPAEDVERRYAALAAQNFGQNPEAMDEYLFAIGSSPNALKRQILGEIAWQNALRRNVIPFTNVSEEEAQELLDRLEADRGTDEYRLGEIYFAATDENRQAVFENAQRIVEQLQQGASFVAYARQFSDATTAVVGGDTGFLRLGTLPAPMAEAAQRLQPGQLVGPLEIPGGFTIIYLIEKRQVLTPDPLDSLLSLKQIAVGFSEGTTEAEAAARVEEFGTYVQGLRGCADAESAREAIGATVVTNEQLAARQLPSQLQSLVLELQIGQTTPPFGSIEDGVRVLMLCGRDDPEVEGGPTVETIMAQIEEDRVQKRAQSYLRDLRNDAFIEYN
ncbi:MAG: peptidylprolyl isomerase [Erythrobacter sp.]